jgi:hypothetical protein
MREYNFFQLYRRIHISLTLTIVFVRYYTYILMVLSLEGRGLRGKKGCIAKASDEGREGGRRRDGRRRDGRRKDGRRRDGRRRDGRRRDGKRREEGRMEEGGMEEGGMEEGRMEKGGWSEE